MHPAAALAMQHRRGRSLGSGGLTAVGERDEDLILFHEMQRREHEDKSFSHPASIQGNLRTPQAAHKPLNQSIQRALIGRNDDMFSSDWDRNDYDWLLTPPTTPLVLPLDLESPGNGLSLNGTTSVRSAITASRLGSSKSEPPSRAEPSSRSVRGNVGTARNSNGLVLQSASINTSSGLSSSTSTVSRRSLPSSSNGASRSSTPSSSAARRPSTPSSSTPVSRTSAAGSTTVARPSTPTSRVAAPRLVSANPSSTIRPATPSGRTPSPITRSASSSRPSTPVKRPSTPTRQSTPSTTMVRSSSISKAGGPPTATRSAASSRSSSPTVKALHPAVVPGISQEPPPNLRTSMPERSSSNSRGSSVTSRSGGPLTARTSQPEAPERRRQSSSPLVARGRLSSESQTGDRVIRMNGKPELNGTLESLNATNIKMVDKTARPRRPIPTQEEQGSIANALLKRTPKPTLSRDSRPTPVREVKSSPSRDVKSTTSSIRESSGFGRNLSKKSLDMALRHMDIHRSTSNGFQSFMSNVSASSLYSIKSSATRGVSSSFLAGSPVATSSNASSEHSASIVLDREASEQGDERASEKASKSSPAGSQPDALLSLTNERRVTHWLGSPEYRENGDVMQIFQRGIEALSGSESPLVSPHHNAVGLCGNFSLEPMH